MVEPTAGTVLCDRYEVRALIGQGGMASVFEAFDLLRKEKMALKMIASEWLDHEEIYDRFVDEAILTSRLNHPNIVNVRNIEHSEYGVFITMELLKGRTLREEMNDRKRRGTRCSIEEVRQLISQLCQALAYAHLYTVHRDLKPENIWLEEGGRLKLMDFGLAMVRGPQSQTVSIRTQTGASFGTPYYIAPEQLHGQADVTSAADQYSVGAIAYELLTGEVPAGVPKPIESDRSDISRREGRAIRRALARQPERRFPSMNAFEETFCSSRSWVRMLADSPPLFAAAAVVVFLSGVLCFSIIEQLAALRSKRHQDRTYWTESSLLLQMGISNRWDQLSQSGEVIEAQVGMMDVSVLDQASVDSVHVQLRRARQAISSGRLDKGALLLSSMTSELAQSVEKTRILASNRLEVARLEWKKVLNPNTTVLIPDLSHIADPEGWVTKAEEESAIGNHLTAARHYGRASEIYTQWTGELKELNRRTESYLEMLPMKPLFHTNSIGMVFARIPKTDVPRQHLWVSIWETRVVDYARFAADGGNWLSRFDAGDTWRVGSAEGGLTMPVTQVSQNEAERFCSWLQMYDSDHNPNRIDIGPSRVTPVLMSKRHLDVIDDRMKEFELRYPGFKNEYPRGIYAFSDVWPPFRERPTFTGDDTLEARRFIRPVAMRGPNLFGLFDCNGNVWERTAERLYHGATHWFNGAVSSELLVGGSGFGTVAISDNPAINWPEYLNQKKIGRIDAIGFRVVLYLN